MGIIYRKNFQEQRWKQSIVSKERTHDTRLQEIQYKIQSKILPTAHCLMPAAGCSVVITLPLSVQFSHIILVSFEC